LKSKVQEMNNVLLLAMPSGMEWIIILFAVLLLFGGKKIPELMRGVGKGIREFNDAKNNVSREIRDGMNDEPKKSEEK
jgi:sec-independent protein translocase protein TatA